MADPITVGIIIAAIGAIGAAAALIFWRKILAWAEDSLFPWINKNIPSIEDQVRLAFAMVDKVATPIRLAVKEAWSELRKYLLKQTIELERESSSKWTKRVTSWVVKRLESGEVAPVKVVTEEVVSPDELPPEVREAWLRHKQNKAEFNVTETRDKEVMEMTA
ncbi:hypothetical protein H6G93_08625 [Nostoc sp. FACHB-973]|nr:hypothetical protein [Nostoc sp. FACHB-973]